ncbi:CDP-alcohol phosphatidyltransferase family protein [Amycolatopsis palatopharyngis]|uniref:CDP-alcohol phosphatidyltransferase family protein n=1 Tax=Amycolatopsis palatopharyngis TaxID=187982 RepID=UPI001B882F42|nr:CDP-alcohol phosphatidyltransferase family protein [Amycolatopsis palatopharyngis]
MKPAVRRLVDEPDSRAATDQLLTEVRAGRWRPRAWGRLLAHAGLRSVGQARSHQRALAELTALHLLFVASAGRGRRRWPLVSWLLAASHLGLLEHRRSIGYATVLTLVRANLPVFAAGRWVPALALATDIADGRLARALEDTSPFGAAADSLADAAFWSWVAVRHEPSRRLRAVALLAWAAPVLTVTGVSVGRGRMVDAPRPILLRPAALLQAVLAIRAVLRRPGQHRP